MLDVGTGELLVILTVALLILGPERLPEAARRVGRAMAELRRHAERVKEDLAEGLLRADEETGPRADGRR